MAAFMFFALLLSPGGPLDHSVEHEQLSLTAMAYTTAAAALMAVELLLAAPLPRRMYQLDRSRQWLDRFVLDPERWDDDRFQSRFRVSIGSRGCRRRWCRRCPAAATAAAAQSSPAHARRFPTPLLQVPRVICLRLVEELTPALEPGYHHCKPDPYRVGAVTRLALALDFYAHNHSTRVLSEMYGVGASTARWGAAGIGGGRGGGNCSGGQGSGSEAQGGSSPLCVLRPAA